MNPLLIRRRGMMAAAATPETPIFHERIRFDGTAQIQTDILMPVDGSIRMSTGGETREAVQGIFAFRNESTAVVSIWLNSDTNPSRRVYAGRYDSATTAGVHPQVNNYTSRVTVCITPHFLQVGSLETPSSITQGQTRPNGGLLLGAPAIGYNYTGAIGPVYMYDDTALTATSINDLTNNYNPIYTLRPCEYGNDVGYWCVDTGRFYGNTAGAGTLTFED